jgi:hypothetical protein
MRRNRNLALLLSFLAVLALSLTLTGCALLDIGNPTPPSGQTTYQTAEQSLYLAGLTLSRWSYQIEDARAKKLVSEETYDKLAAAWGKAQLTHKALLAGTRPATDLPKLDRDLAAVEALLTALTQMGGAK